MCEVIMREVLRGRTEAAEVLVFCSSATLGSPDSSQQPPERIALTLVFFGGERQV